jgi:hypothetical protein
MEAKIEIGITLGPQNERTYGAIRGFVFDRQMVVTKQSIELLENYPMYFPWKERSGNLMASDYFLLKKEVERTDTTDIPNPLTNASSFHTLTLDNPLPEQSTTIQPRNQTRENCVRSRRTKTCQVR